MSSQSGTPSQPPAEETSGETTGGVESLTPDWLQPGTPPGMEPADVEARSELARFLDATALPGTRADLLVAALEHQAPEHVLSLLRRLPAGEQFGNVQDVARAAGLGTEQHRT